MFGFGRAGKEKIIEGREYYLYQEYPLREDYVAAAEKVKAELQNQGFSVRTEKDYENGRLEVYKSKHQMTYPEKQAQRRPQQQPFRPKEPEDDFL